MDAISEAEAETMDNIFEGYLTDAIPDSQLVEYEILYSKEIKARKTPTPKLKYEYSQCLIRCQYMTNIYKGIHIMEKLCVKELKPDPEHFFYLSLGYARIQEYFNALKFLNIYIKAVPRQKPILAWRAFLVTKWEREKSSAISLTRSPAVLFSLIYNYCVESATILYRSLF